MNWHNLSDKEFDSKIRAHFEEMDLPFAEDSWLAMNGKLDGYASNKDRGNTSNGWLLGIILLLAGLFFWNLTNINQNQARAELISGLTNQQLNASEQSPENKENILESDQKRDEKKTSEQDFDLDSNAPSEIAQQELSNNTSTNTNAGITSGNNSRSRSNTNTSSQLSNNNQFQSASNLSGTTLNQGEQFKKKVPSVADQPQIANSRDGVNDIDQQVSSNSKSTKSRIEATSNSKPKIQNQSQQPNSQAILNNHSPREALSSQANPSDQDLALGNSESRTIVKGSLDLLPPKPPHIKWMVTEAISKVEVPAQEVSETPITDPKLARWSLGFGYAPDLSLVGFSEVTKPGTNVAFNIDYKLNARWSIQTGATIAKKNYIADGEDYSPPAGFWDYGRIPDQADATCTVIDIPINVRYYFGQNRRWYAATGLSTYLMLRENYDYVYRGYYPGAIDNWSVRNENRHFLGVYNLSIGYQKQVANRWFIEVEPFIKAPISGIGFGQVNLWSTGTLFSLRYRLTP